MYGKTQEELTAITLEAERRVRAGEPRAQVAHALGIPISTLAGRAHRGGWRRKDLVTVRDAELGKAALEMINELTAVERKTKLEQAAKMRDALETSKAELEAVAPGGRLPGARLPGARLPGAQLPGAQLPGAMGEGPVPARKLAMAMADNLLRQGRLDEADRAIRLAVRFAQAEQSAGDQEEARWREERERLTKWWAEKQTAYYQLHQAAECALEEITAAHRLEDSRLAEDCCPKCGRRMDFWPQEVERPDDDDSSARSADDDSGVEAHGDDSDDDDSDTDNSGDRRNDDDDSGTRAHDDDSGKRAADSGWKQDAGGDWYWSGPPE